MVIVLNFHIHPYIHVLSFFSIVVSNDLAVFNLNHPTVHVCGQLGIKKKLCSVCSLMC